MRGSRMIAVTVAAFGCCLALTGTALADTSLTVTVGPVTIPSVPVSAWVSVLGISKCVSTPPATTVGVPPLSVPIAAVVGLQGTTFKIYACTGVS
jgi:hypothetical protein